MRSLVTDVLDGSTESLSATAEGPVANYIPELEVVDPDSFAIPDGNHRDEEIPDERHRARARAGAAVAPIPRSPARAARPGPRSRTRADIDMISGATVTSQGYLQSLQSALDQAGL
jgi:hypothetical protein